MSSDAFTEANRLLDAAAAAHRRGRLARALHLVEEAHDRVRRAGGTRDANLGPIRAARGRLHEELGHLAAAARDYARAVSLLTGHRAHAATTTRVQALRALGDLRRGQGRYADARGFLERALRCARRRLGAGHLETGLTENSLGILCKYTHRFAEGRRHYENALARLTAACGENSVEVATVLHNLGGLAHEEGCFAAAEPPARRAFEMRRALLGPTHPDVAADLAAWAAIVDRLGRLAEAESIYRRVIPIFRRVGARYDVAVNLHNLAAVRAARGDFREARRLYRRALVLKTELWGERHPDVRLTRKSLALLPDAR